jgi:galactose mutarotase-like enzyme
MGDLQLGWKSPVKGPVHPAFVRLGEPGGLGFLDGFDELLCRCGLENNGAPEFAANGALRYGLHGKIANTPAHYVGVTIDGESGEITVTGTVDEARLFGNKLRLTTAFTTHAGQPGLTITDTITNLSAEPSEMELLYHTNFGLPLIGPDAKVMLPFKLGAPRDAVAVENVPQWDSYGPFSPGVGEAVFFFELAADADGQTRALLANAAGDRGVSLSFNTRQLPCFSLWKNRQAEADGYVTGLEPAINFPNVRSFEKSHGRVAVLAPGESRTYAITFKAYGDAAAVDAAQQAVAAIQGNMKAEFLKHPNPEWSNV